MTPAEIIERYFAAIRARDIDSLTALYANDATFMLPNGKSFSGKAAIREMHLDVFAAGAPVPSPLASVLGKDCAAVEIEAPLQDGTTRNTANFYYFTREGLIQRLSVYMRG